MKRYLILPLLFLMCLYMTAQTPSIIDRPKVGLVLGGGGAKGAAEVGALKVIEELNIPIDYIAGTSIGAILGGLYA
ncbi:MAG: patatin-like phospholipase family protein, partial [Prevotella sp.]|nr:patatin-like phospholipase family protein [Prevotella sp.]